jgi:hypothetical protein
MNFSQLFTAGQRIIALALVGLAVLSASCASMKQPAPAPTLAETDETLATPMRPPSNQKYAWWDLHNWLDPRAQDIERNLGF